MDGGKGIGGGVYGVREEQIVLVYAHIEHNYASTKDSNVYPPGVKPRTP